MAAEYQNLVPDYPRFPLAMFPSPLHRVERFEAALRDTGTASVPKIFLKRDDLLSLGLGGNKIRNLEFLIGQALAEGATDVITEGRQQSNHCRLTAAACAKAGLRAHLVLTGTRPERFMGNLLLDRLLGARVYFTGSDERSLRQAWVGYLAPVFDSFGGKSFAIPVGGSDVRGTLGHVLLAAEIVEDMDGVGEEPAAVVLATATGGTQAGLLAGLRKLGRATPVTGFAVAKSAEELAHDVARLTTGTAAEIGGPNSDASDVVVDGRGLGGGYGVATEEAQQAIEVLARSEGIFADPVYTGKGLAGLISFVREGRFSGGDAVVFVHTGGAPALFA